jgi:hypothetical protein
MLVVKPKISKLKLTFNEIAYMKRGDIRNKTIFARLLVPMFYT